MKTLARNRLRTTLSDSVLLLLTSTTFVILTYLLGNVAFLYPLKTLKNRKVLFSGGNRNATSGKKWVNKSLLFVSLNMYLPRSSLHLIW